MVLEMTVKCKWYSFKFDSYLFSYCCSLSVVCDVIMQTLCILQYFCYYLTLSQTSNLDSSKLKEFADDTFKFDENGRKFFKSVENTVGKGEIARYEQFLFFPQCFLKTRTAGT